MTYLYMLRQSRKKIMTYVTSQGKLRLKSIESHATNFVKLARVELLVYIYKRNMGHTPDKLVFVTFSCLNDFFLVYTLSAD